jgi:hypothetical protein
MGHAVVLPEAISSPSDYPTWSTWSDKLIGLLPTAKRLTLVGHSSASVLVAQLANLLDTEAIVFVDGLVPPASGPAGPVPARLLGMLDALCGADGTLPPWSDWWTNNPLRDAVGVPLLQADELAYQQFRQSLPHMTRDWFNDVVELSPWRHTPAGYLQLSSLYENSANEAEALGWPVVRLQGTHIHPTVAPNETASAIATLCAQLQSAV